MDPSLCGWNNASIALLKVALKKNSKKETLLPYYARARLETSSLIHLYSFFLMFCKNALDYFLTRLFFLMYYNGVRLHWIEQPYQHAWERYAASSIWWTCQKKNRLSIIFMAPPKSSQFAGGKKTNGLNCQKPLGKSSLIIQLKRTCLWQPVSTHALATCFNRVLQQWRLASTPGTGTGFCRCAA